MVGLIAILGLGFFNNSNTFSAKNMAAMKSARIDHEIETNRTLLLYILFIL